MSDMCSAAAQLLPRRIPTHARSVAYGVVLYPGIALPEPYVSTTANQAEAMAPFWVWWLGLFLASLVLHPILLHAALRSRSSTLRPPRTSIWGLSAFHFMTGATIFIFMLAISLGYSKTSPLFFVACWVGLSLLVTGCYVVGFLIRRRRASFGELRRDETGEGHATREPSDAP